MRNLDPHQPGFDEHFATIGRFIVAFQQLEFTITHFLSIFSAHPSRVAPNNMMQSILADSSFKNLLKFSRTLPVLLDPARLFAQEDIREDWSKAHERFSAQLLEALKMASRTEQRRNQLVHSTWITDADVRPNNAKVYRVKTRNRRGQVEMIHEYTSPDVIAQDTAQCRQTEIQLQQALKGLFDLGQEYIEYENQGNP